MHSLRSSILALAIVVSIPASSFAQNPGVYFKSPAEGATVKSPVKVEMGVNGMTVAKAGDVKPGEGHHHLIVDGAPAKEGEVVAKDETHLHFGQGQTSAEVPLAPGTHTLTLQFADGAHRAYGPAFNSTIHVTVAP